MASLSQKLHYYLHLRVSSRYFLVEYRNSGGHPSHSLKVVIVLPVLAEREILVLPKTAPVTLQRSIVCLLD